MFAIRVDNSAVGESLSLRFEEGELVEDYVIAGQRLILGHRHPKLNPSSELPVQISYVDLPQDRKDIAVSCTLYMQWCFFFG